MLRSMFAGVSGLRSHQTMLDVTGNNISNVNTTGFKTSRATFQDALYQVSRGATGGTPATGGINPMQIGLGTRVAAVDGIFSQGALQPTNRSTDIAIQGEGFFIIKDQAGANLFTRSGAFNFDSAGNLVAAGGEIVQGVSGANPPTNAALAVPATPTNITVDPAVLGQMRDIAVGADGHITARDTTGAEVFLGRVATASFLNPNGLNRLGNSNFSASANSGLPEVGAPGTGNRGLTVGGSLEMSNVDLAQEFTQLIMAQRGFQANARTITTSDELIQELVNLKR